MVSELLLLHVGLRANHILYVSPQQILSSTLCQYHMYDLGVLAFKV